MLERSRYGTRSERLRGATLSDEQHAYAFVFDEIKTVRPGGDRSRARKHRSGQSRNVRRVPAKASHLIWSGSRLSSNLAGFPQAVRDWRRFRSGEDVSEPSGRDAGEVPGNRHAPPEHTPTRNRDGGDPGAGATEIIESGIPTEAATWPRSPSPTYADGLPLYRQEAIYARDQVELSRSLMAQWMGAVGFRTAASGRLRSGTDQAGRTGICR